MTTPTPDPMPTTDWETAPPPPDRTGYTVTEQGGTDLRGNPMQTTWSIVRDSTGTGLGAYANQADIDLVIANDRANNPPPPTPAPTPADGPAITPTDTPDSTP